MGRDREDPVERARAAMVDRQLRGRGIADPRVLEVMGRLPREAFVTTGTDAGAYVDAALPIDHGQTISQPFVVARMTELVGVSPGDRILDVGTGSGYQAAVLAGLGARVRSIERLPALADAARDRLARLGIDGVEVVVGDGSLGDPDGAPWDGIVVAAAAPSVPGPLREQLAIGARLVVPVGDRRGQELIVVERMGPADWVETSDGAVVFVPLVGAAGFGSAGSDATGSGSPRG